MIRRCVAVLALFVLAACSSNGAGGDASGASISTAPKAPKSDFTVACPPFTDPNTKPASDQLPALSLECLGSEGDPVSISGKPERPTVINVWASWCGPCRDEMPLLQKLAQSGDGKINVMGLVSNDNRDSATAYALEMGLTFPSVLDPKGQVVAGQGLPGIPDTLFLDGDGTLVYKHVGPYKKYEDLVADVATYLKVTL